MSNLSRRKLITAGLCGNGGRIRTGRGRESCGPLRAASRPITAASTAPGETLTYASQRLLTRHSLAREFPRSQISKPPFANGSRSTGRSVRAPAGGRLRGLAARRGWHGRPPRLVLARRTQELSLPQPDHSPGLRRRLVLTLPNGPACLCPISWTSWGSFRKPGMLSTSRYSPTGGTASIWPMPCILRLSSPTE